jgi:hypothetical protein
MYKGIGIIISVFHFATIRLGIDHPHGEQKNAKREYAKTNKPPGCPPCDNTNIKINTAITAPITTFVVKLVSFIFYNPF